MSKKIVYQCDFCHDWVNREDIRRYKRVKYNWKNGWEKTKFDICDVCDTNMSLSLYNKRKERERKEREDE